MAAHQVTTRYLAARFFDCKAPTGVVNGDALETDQVSGEGYDVIGDIHGYGDHLEGLLIKMGYVHNGQSFSHPNRRVVFVGDLVDRGPNQFKTVDIARSMVSAGSAKMVLGNHEINAIGYTIADPSAPGEFVRPHNERNSRTHEAFLAQLVEGSEEYNDAIAWFKSLPIWLDLDGIRVVHACWDQNSIDVLAAVVDPDDAISDQILTAAPGSPERKALSVLTRGPEVPIKRPYMNTNGGISSKARFKWWNHESATMCDVIALPSGARCADGSPYPPLDDDPVQAPIDPYTDSVPVLFGHYWFKGAPARITPYIACLDYSVAGRGPLVAYRWQGERELDDGNFVQVDHVA